MSHLDVRYRAFQSTGPVDESITPVDISRLVESYESLGYGAAQFWVHRETGTIPVERTAQFTELAIDAVSFTVNSIV